MKILTIACVPLLAATLNFVDPRFPPNAISGGLVVAELSLSGGAVDEVSIVSGEEPFAGSCRNALAGWRLSPEDHKALVIVYFRQPYLFSFSASEHEVTRSVSKSELPYPKFVVEPVYPTNALGQDAVILSVDVGADGSVSEVDVVKSAGVFTETSVGAVRKWRFAPAVGTDGENTPSHAYVVIVFRFLLTVP